MLISACIPVEGDPFISSVKFRKVKINQYFQYIKKCFAEGILYRFHLRKAG
nr:MAG TPA_asm: hypothetical protein [Caudoviricetes sp.]